MLKKYVSKKTRTGLVLKSMVFAAFAPLLLNNQAQAEDNAMTGAAAGVTLTLDEMSANAPAFTTTSHYELTTTQGTNTHFLLLDNGSGTLTKYYYTPQETGSTPEETQQKNNMLTYLAGTALTTEGASESNYIFKQGSNYYTFDTSNLPQSAYTLTPATSGGFLVNLPEYNEETGALEDKTYNLAVKEQGTGEQSVYFKWSTDAGGTNRKLVQGTSSDHDFVAKINAGSGDTSVYYKWTTDENGNLQLTTDGASASDYDLAAKYQTAGTTVSQTEAIAVTATGTSSESPTIVNVGIIKNPTGNISDTLYLNNATSAAISQTATGRKYARVYGGAISNNTNSGVKITADFWGNNLTAINEVDSSSGYYLILNSVGGAISNYATSSTSALIDEITGDFIANYINNTHTSNIDSGGAIGNYGYDSSRKAVINKITGDFIGNYIIAQSSDGNGGAIYNGHYSQIGTVTGDFIANYINTQSSSGHGGALENSSYSSIESITGDFIGNYVDAETYGYGGAISNITYSQIGSITGDFIENYIYSHKYSADNRGGAIHNERATIKSITGNFIGNYIIANSTSSSGSGAAIANYFSATIESIKGDFIGNHINAPSSYSTGGGGAIESRGPIGSITGDFIGNYINAGSSAWGGAINNYSSIGTITGNFIENYINAYPGYGGAISNYRGPIGSITGDFIGNYIKSQSKGYGGAIYNNGSNTKIGSIKGDFIGNYINARSEVQGGAIYNNSSTIGTISGDFIENYVSGSSSSSGGAIYNNNSATIENITSDFIRNYTSGSSSSSGGAIYNSNSQIGTITGNFANNYAKTYSYSGYRAYGGAIYNNNSATIESITGDFIGNYISTGNGFGGAIYNSSSIIGSITGDFTDNYAQTTSPTGKVYGGAIYNGGIAYLSGTYIPSYNADSKITLVGNTFTGNYVNNNGTITPNSIYNAGLINIADNTTVTVNDGWQSFDDGTNAGKLVMGTGSTLNLNIGNDVLQDDSLGAVTNVGTINATVDVDVTNQKADTISVSSVTQEGIITLGSLNVLDGSFDHITDENFKIQILKTPNDNLQLALSDEVKEQIQDGVERLLNTTTSTSTDELKLHTDWDDKYASHTTVDKLYGSMGLTQTDTTNDSIGIKNARTESTTTDTPLGDTLAIVNQANLDGRTFDFDTAGDVYTVTENLGTTGEGKFTINGVAAEDGSKSTIDFDGHSGMNISNASDVIIKDVVMTNAQKFIGQNNGVVLHAGNAGAKITIENVDFTDNNAQASGKISGGVISNLAEIISLSGKFENNSFTSTNNATYGVVISNETGANIGTITGKFINNHGFANLNRAGKVGAYGAIYNKGTIGDISADFIGNTITDTSGSYGSAIANYNGKIGNINGNFINNSSTTLLAASDATGAIMLQDGGGTIINSISGYFEGNTAQGAGRASAGAINNNSNAIITEGVTANFVKNYAESTGTSALARGGAVVNFGYTPHITGDFTENHAESSGTGAIGGAIAILHSNSNILEKDGIDKLQGDYTGNYALATGENGYAHGGAIYNTNIIGEIQNSNFKNNFAKSETGEAKGGAIYTTKDLNIVAQDGYTSNFEGNFVVDNDGMRPEAIYVDNNAALTLDANTNGKFVFNDQINGASQYKLKLKGDSSGKIYFNNDIKNADIEHNDVTTYVNGAKYLNQPDALNSLTMNSGTMNIGKIALAPIHFDTFGMNGGTINIDSVDVDLANKTMGRITANNYTGEGKGTINVKAMNIVSDAKGLITPVEFADKSFKNTVKTEVKEAYTPIYKYDVEYDTEQRFNQENDNGYFVFKRSVRPSGGDEPTPAPTPENFNPAVIASPVATQMGANTAMNEALRFAFEHGDTFMNFSAMDRFAQINQNTYAMAGNNPLLSTELTSSPRRGKHISLGGEKNLLANNSELTNSREGKLALSTDFNENLSYTDLSHENKSVWVKPYSVFEKIDLKNGPKVDTISYGTLVGFDSNIHRMKKGWYNVGTAYIGYNGSQIDYKGVDASMNGGLLGLTETFYKGNFWTAITATAGAGVAEAHTMYGKDDMTMLMAGIGSKTGYNFEFADGKFIIQPRMFISYSMINTFDYTNAAGVRIDSDPMHTIQLNPAIKFIGNTKNGWQPYASVGMMWNLLNETETTANGVKLPEMHTKPYVEYGVGIQKLWNDKYSAYGQAMVRNGGRTGVALTLGFRMALGNDGKPIERTQKDKQILKQVQNDNSKKILRSAQNDNKNNIAQNNNNYSTKRKVLKQLSPTQKAHLTNSTRTSMLGVIK